MGRSYINTNLNKNEVISKTNIIGGPGSGVNVDEVDGITSTSVVKTTDVTTLATNYTPYKYILAKPSIELTTKVGSVKAVGFKWFTSNIAPNYRKDGEILRVTILIRRASDNALHFIKTIYGSSIDELYVNTVVDRTGLTNVLELNTNYIAYVRTFYGAYRSEQSNNISFTTSNISYHIIRPVLTAANSSVNTDLTPYLYEFRPASGQTNYFVASDPGIKHLSSSWIVEDINGNILFESLNDEVNLKRIIIPNKVITEGKPHKLTAVMNSKYKGIVIKSEPYITQLYASDARYEWVRTTTVNASNSYVHHVQTHSNNNSYTTILGGILDNVLTSRIDYVSHTSAVNGKFTDIKDNLGAILPLSACGGALIDLDSPTSGSSYRIYTVSGATNLAGTTWNQRAGYFWFKGVGQPSPYTYVTMPTLVPIGIVGNSHTVNFLNDKLFVIGGGKGFVPNAYKTLMAVTSDYTNHKEDMFAIVNTYTQPQMMYHAAVTLDSDVIFVTGGKTPTEDATRDTWYVTKEGVFLKGPPLPVPLKGHVMIYMDNNLVLICGGVTKDEIYTSACFLFNTDTGETEYIIPLPEPRAYGNGAVTPNGVVILTGGTNKSVFGSSNNITLSHTLVLNKYSWVVGP